MAVSIGTLMCKLVGFCRSRIFKFFAHVKSYCFIPYFFFTWIPNISKNVWLWSLSAYTMPWKSLKAYVLFGILELQKLLKNSRNQNNFKWSLFHSLFWESMRFRSIWTWIIDIVHKPGHQIVQRSFS